MSDIFISYRRTQTVAADRIYERLCRVFEPNRIYLDRERIEPGSKFPEEIARALDSAKVVLAIIDPDWISVQHPRFKRRRLDMRNDWVRIEIGRSLQEDKTVIPVLVDGAPMPDRDELPARLGALATRNFVRIRTESFAGDVDGLIERMKAKLSEANLQEFLDDKGHPFPPIAEFKPVAIEGDLLETMIKGLPGWNIKESPVEDDPRIEQPTIRREIVRDFRFPSFLAAIDFMKSAAELIDMFDHHPRWQNVFRTVTVALTTWDIGHQLSDRDFNTAIMIERHYKRFIESL